LAASLSGLVHRGRAASGIVLARPHETDQAGRLERGLFLGGLLFGPALGALLAYVSHPWWLHGSGSFAAAYDFVRGIAFGGGHWPCRGPTRGRPHRPGGEGPERVTVTHVVILLGSRRRSRTNRPQSGVGL